MSSSILRQHVEELERCVLQGEEKRRSDAEELGRQLAEALEEHKERLSSASVELEEERLRLAEEKKRSAFLESELGNVQSQLQSESQRTPPQLQAMELELRKLKGALNVREETLVVLKHQAANKALQHDKEQRALNNEKNELKKTLKDLQDMAGK